MFFQLTSLEQNDRSCHAICAWVLNGRKLKRTTHTFRDLSVERARKFPIAYVRTTRFFGTLHTPWMNRPLYKQPPSPSCETDRSLEDRIAQRVITQLEHGGLQDECHHADCLVDRRRRRPDASRMNEQENFPKKTRSVQTPCRGSERSSTAGAWLERPEGPKKWNR